MNEPISLTLEQQFSLRSFETQVNEMSREQAQEFLVKLYELMLTKETFWKSQLGSFLSGDSAPCYLKLEDTDEARVLIDFEDFGWLIQWKWYSSSRGYARRNLAGSDDSCQTLMHRLILEKNGVCLKDSIDVDHIDGNPLNNQKSNLRVATHQQNCANRKISKNNTSFYKGVSRYRDKWRATIKVNYKQIHLGYFLSPEQAAKAYNDAAIKHFGEFARLNEIEESGS